MQFIEWWSGSGFRSQLRQMMQEGTLTSVMFCDLHRSFEVRTGNSCHKLHAEYNEIADESKRTWIGATFLPQYVTTTMMMMMI